MFNHLEAAAHHMMPVSIVIAKELGLPYGRLKGPF
jgi:hypothetical protein